MTQYCETAPADQGRRDFLIASGIATTAAVLPLGALAQVLAGDPHYDVSVVGRGAAGAALAHRLGVHPARCVPVTEAGEAHAPKNYPDPGAPALRVADAWIFPDVSSVATNPTVFMAADRGLIDRLRTKAMTISSLSLAAANP